jgi:hypothetical protein
MVWDEAAIAKERINSMEVTRASLMQQAISSILSKKAGSAFQKNVASLNIETIPASRSARFEPEREDGRES